MWAPRQEDLKFDLIALFKDESLRDKACGKY